MAIALDATSISTSQTSSPCTWSHTTSGSDRLLIVGVSVRNTGTTNPTVSGVTYNGVSMTVVTNQANSGTANRINTYMFMLHAPATGSNTVSVSFAGGGGGVVTCAGTATSYTGAQQSSTADNLTTINATGTGVKSATLTPIADACWIACQFTSGDASTDPTIGTSIQTQRHNQALGTGGVFGMQDTNGAISPASSTNNGWTVTGTGGTSTRNTGVVASFAPSGGGGGGYTYNGKFFSMF